MAKKVIQVSVTYVYELEIDTESSYVKDYDSEEGMIEDLVHYRFSTLPVIGNGVIVKDVEIDSHIVLAQNPQNV